MATSDKYFYKFICFQVLIDFPSATAALHLDHFFEIFQPIRPRGYSISSSVEVLNVNVLEYLFHSIICSPKNHIKYRLLMKFLSSTYGGGIIVNIINTLVFLTRAV